MATFNFNEFKNGKKATTKLGIPVRFITMLRDGRMLVEVSPRSRIVQSNGIKYSISTSEKYTDKYYMNGQKYKNYSCDHDLIMESRCYNRDERGRFAKNNIF